MAERTDIPKKDRHAILREAGYCCAVPICGTTLAIDLHHIWEVKNGGGNELSNLIALCPTHHALYHRGHITAESVAEWKQRLITINEVGAHTIHKILAELLQSRSGGDKRGSGSGFDGFPLAAAEFMQRTCEIGFVLGATGERFVKTGLCCFVQKELAFTVAWVVDAALEVAQARKGRPVIHTMRGMAPFEVVERYDVGDLVSVKIGAIDDSYLKPLLAEHDPDVAKAFYEPLQTDVKYRMVPFVGELVGFLSCSNADDKWKSGINPFRFESCSVSFLARGKQSREFAQYVLTPSLSRLEYRGAPVFTGDGSLVGIVRDTVQMEDDIGMRPLITSMIPLKSLFAQASISKKSEERTQGA